MGVRIDNANKVRDFIWSFYDDFIAGKMVNKQMEVLAFQFASSKGISYDSFDSLRFMVSKETDLMLEKYHNEEKENDDNKYGFKIMKVDPLPKITFHHDDITIGMVKENPELWNDWNAQQKR